MRYIFFIAGFFLVTPGFTARYFVAPDNDLSSTVSGLSPGDTLILQDGTYKKTFNIAVSGIPGQPVTIKAENDGLAIIDGEDTREVIVISGRHHIVLEGLVCKNSSKQVVKVESSTGITVRRCSASRAGPGNHNTFTFDHVEDVLVEDCIAYGRSRIMYDYWCSSRGTFRRCWARWEESGDDPSTAFTAYGSDHCIFENCIATESAASSGKVEAFKANRRGDNPQGGDNRYLGCIAYDIKNGWGWISWGELPMGNNIVENLASIHCYRGIEQYSDKALTMNNVVIVGPIRTQAFRQEESDDQKTCEWGLNAVLRNLSILNCERGLDGDTASIDFVSISCETVYPRIDHDFTNFYNVAVKYTDTDAESHERNLDPGYDTARYGKGAYLLIPPALKAQGVNGADIGAEVLYLYEGGVKTSRPMWPFPTEERIFRETGQSVTWEAHGGLWKTLDDVYGAPAETNVLNTGVSPSASGTVFPSYGQNKTGTLFNYPNPFSVSTTIEYDLTRPGRITMIAYDISGKEVARLVDNKYQAEGKFIFQWSPSDHQGSIPGNGVYLIRLTTAFNTRTLLVTHIQ